LFSSVRQWSGPCRTGGKTVFVEYTSRIMRRK
jgi:hypothetical protein